MQRKIELHEIMAYAPYGLKFSFRGWDETDPTIVLLESISYTDKCMSFKGAPDLYLDEKESDGEYFPLLLPLSALLNIDWIAIFQVGLDALKAPIPESCIGEYHLELTEDSAELLINSHDSISFDFVEKQFSTDMRFNQIAAFNKIFELHGDLFGILEANLALDKRDY